MIREIKNENKYYMDHKVHGAYETRDLVVISDENKQMAFEDTELTVKSDRLRSRREMWVDGQTYIVSSIFPAVPTTTPTKKMLQIIEKDLEKSC